MEYKGNIEIDGDVWTIEDFEDVDGFEYRLPTFKNEEGVEVTPTFDEDEDVTYWAILIETECKEWMDTYEKAKAEKNKLRIIELGGGWSYHTHNEEAANAISGVVYGGGFTTDDYLELSQKAKEVFNDFAETTDLWVVDFGIIVREKDLMQEFEEHKKEGIKEYGEEYEDYDLEEYAELMNYERFNLNKYE